MSLQVCADKKARKDRGCVLCTYPQQVEKDLVTIESLVVGRTIAPKTAAEKRQPFYIKGLTPQPIRMSRRIAAKLLEKIQTALANTPKI